MSLGRAGRSAITVIVALAGVCAARAGRAAYTLRRVERGDPAGDAAAALARGDRRLVAVEGIATIAPGAGAYERDPRTWPAGLRVIPFTSDAPYWGWERRLNQAAWAYARAYNARLLRDAGGPPAT